MSKPPLDSALVALLVCPVTRGPLRYNEATSELMSEEAGLAFPVRDGVPIILIEAARAL